MTFLQGQQNAKRFKICLPSLPLRSEKEKRNVLSQVMWLLMIKSRHKKLLKFSNEENDCARNYEPTQNSIIHGESWERLLFSHAILPVSQL